MQTNLADFMKGTAEGDEAEAILRACVHCGFCTATCPTYQILGDELDGPRGRIYLIKQVLEGAPVTKKTQTHLDRCLTCRNCETTCPSGVKYGRLADIGRKVVEARVPRPLGERITRTLLKEALPRKWIFTPLYKAGKLFRPLLSPAMQDKLPKAAPAGVWPQRAHARKMLVLEGCVQPAMAPNINAAAARVLDAFGVQLLVAPKAGCCGALRYHLNDQEAALDDMRRNIDAWWPLVDQVEAIVMTASGCGVTVKEYGHLLVLDPAYAAKAQRISALTRDLSEIMPQFEIALGAKLKGKFAKKV
ncbi:MAG: glycolate oxidase subunit GlcF, partial [Massilia sp.]|nr:glycolate oxidase subunit GlcF [Massilia sp.]